MKEVYAMFFSAIKLERFSDAISDCLRVLQEDPTNTKGEAMFQKKLLAFFFRVVNSNLANPLLCRPASQGNGPSGTEGVSRSQTFTGAAFAERTRLQASTGDAERYSPGVLTGRRARTT